jgi:peroxiredoxin Q/BCP
MANRAERRRPSYHGVNGTDFRELPMAVEEGDKAPAFTMPTDGGGTVKLADLTGKTVVLYFYPKDDTSGCTKEAVDFTAQLDRFKKAGALVIGVSKDTPAKHDAFKSKHKLKVLLATDETGKVCDKFGVWVQKTLYGRKYMGIDRSTFLIDGRGSVRRVWRKVKVPGHVDEVLAAVRQL